VLRLVDVQTVSIAIASVSVTVAAIYYIFQIRNQTRIRKTDFVTKLASTWNSKEYAEASFRVLLLEFKDYEGFVKKYGGIPSLNPDSIACRMVATFFEHVGMLLRKKLVEPDLIFDLFLVKDSWEKLKPLIEGLRKQNNSPRLLEWFEYLYNEEQKREQKLQQGGVKSG
jgi:hypothetical protein